MRFSSIRTADIANGLGWRVTLWCTGCLRKCPGCFNEEAQDPNFGQVFDEEEKQKIFNELSKHEISGLSLMGGEPLSRLSDNRKQTIQLCKECKERFPDKDIWMWTGFLIDEILNDATMRPILDYVDVLIDGPFINDKKDLSCPWRGSTNQRVIDVVEWRKTGNIVEKKFN